MTAPTSKTPKPRPPGGRKRASAKTLAEKPVPLSRGYAESFDGTKIFYTSEGEGVPIVFCYGLLCSTLHWTYQIEHFRKTHRCIWFDYRGHQNSDVPKDLKSLTVKNLARDLEAVLDELKIDKAVLLAHSMGVNVALEFAHRNPKRVHGLVLANGAAQRPLETLFSHNAFLTGFKLLKKTYQSSPDLVSKLWRLQKNNPISQALIAYGGFNPHLTSKQDIAMYVDQVAEIDPSIFIHLIENYHKHDAQAWLHTLKTPTLLISGAQDKVTPPEQQELMQQLLPDARLESVRHGSHCPQMDMPEIVNKKIEKFLAELQWK